MVPDACPTGVAVSWAQRHGGPWRVDDLAAPLGGHTATRRSLRPVTPKGVLPPERTDGPSDVPRRNVGVLVLPERASG